MDMTDKLPPYFQKYLDGKFDEVMDEISEIKTLVAENSKRITVLERLRDKIVFIWGTFTVVVAVAYDYIKNKYFR